MLEEETLTDYRRRLRVLIEDLALSGITKTLEEILVTWKRGLLPLLKYWLFLLERAFPDNGTAIETVYRFERLVIQRGGGLEIDNIAFIVSSESPRPELPDFRVWVSIREGWTYAHDVRKDHSAVKDDTAYEDDWMLSHVILCKFPMDALLSRPAVIPEVGCKFKSFARKPVKKPQMSVQTTEYMHVITTELIDGREGKRRRMEAEKYVSNFNYAKWIGSATGGWIEENAPQSEKRKPIPKGLEIRTTDLSLAPPGAQDRRVDVSDSSSDDEDLYPELDPKDKGKRPLYPDA